MTIDGRIAMSAVMVAIFGALVIDALGFPPPARLLPWVIGIPGVVLTAAQLCLDIAAARREPPAAPDDEESARRTAGERAMFGWLAMFFASLLLLGFLIGGPLALFLYLRFAAKERLLIALIGAACGWAVLYGVFETLLQLSLFEGFLPLWLLG